MFRDKKKERKVVILLDYLNISLSIAQEGKVLNLPALIDMALEIGEVKAALAFAPLTISWTDLNLMDQAGFFCIACPRQIEEGKEKDKVDSRMVNFAMRVFAEDKEVTDVIIVSNDGDFLSLITTLKAKRKKVQVWGTEKISITLRQVVKIRHIPAKNPRQ